MDSSPTAPARSRVLPALPWIVALAALALYLFTLNSWVSVTSLPIVGQVAGWDDKIPYDRPLLYLITRPLALLSAEHLTLAVNGLNALLAAACVGLLVQCVRLLPHDRTKAERIRGYGDGQPLSAPFAWVPPVLAASVLGLQLTFWEHATALTGEMVSLLVFGWCIRCLLAYRRNRRDALLYQFAFCVGLGMADNWAMIGYGPLFAIALVWIRGYTILDLSLIIRLAGFWVLGLGLYLVMPIAAHGHAGMPDSIFETLGVLTGLQKNILLGLPKGRFLMLASLMLLPLGAIGFRSPGAQGSGAERIATLTALNVLKLAWLAAGIALAFDPAISPRRFVTLNADYLSLPLLTFHFAGALTVGYLAGYFMILGGLDPARQWDRTTGAIRGLQKAGFGILFAGVVVLPAALVWKNWPAIRAQNGTQLADLARRLTEGLPNRPALVLSDDDNLYGLFNAYLHHQPSLPRHYLVDTRLVSNDVYRHQLAERHPDSPEIKALGATSNNVAGLFIQVVNSAANTSNAFYLNPSASMLLERLQLRPHGAIFRLLPYAPGQITPPPLSAAESEAVTRYWNGAQPALDALSDGVSKGAATSLFIGGLLARNLNNQGVDLQRSGQHPAAADLFAHARRLQPGNLAVQVNADVNRVLQKKQFPGPEQAKPLANYSPLSVLENYGAVDEPRFLSLQGEYFLILTEPLARGAALAFTRARELAPADPGPIIGFADACLAAGEPRLTLRSIGEARTLIGTNPASPAHLARLGRIEAAATARLGDLGKAETLLRNNLDRYPNDTPSLDLLTTLYVETLRASNAVPYLNRLVQLKPDDDALVERKAYLHLMLGQYKEAIATLDPILDRKPELHSARFNRGTARLVLGQLDDAEVDFRHILKRKPRSPEVVARLGDIAMRRKDPATAQKEYQQALELTPPGTPSYSNLVERLNRARSGQ